MNILITGGTGFLGSYLVKELAPQFETVYVLTRKKIGFDKFKDLKNVHLVLGDITETDVLSKSESERSEILNKIDVVLHAAALYDMTADYSTCSLQNIIGTKNVVNLLASIKNLKALYYISTIAVGDIQKDILKEDFLPQRDHFTDAYSQTKYLAEQYVRGHASRDYVTRVIRPGIIIGDTKTLEMPKIDGPYYFLKTFEKYLSLLRLLPMAPLSYDPTSELPIIPVDHCARLIRLLIERDTFKKGVKGYHLVSCDLPSMKDFLSDVNIHFNMKTKYIAVKENFIHNSLLKILGIPKEVLPFMFSKISYDKSNTLEDLPEIKESTYRTFKHVLFQKSQF